MLRSQHGRAVRHPCAPHAVRAGDDSAVVLELEDHLQQLLRQVKAVADELDVHTVQQVSALNRSKHPEAAASGYGAHSAVEMGQKVQTVVIGFGDYVICCRGMGSRYHNALLHHRVYESHGTGSLGGDGPSSDKAVCSLQEGLVMLRRRVPDVSGILCSLLHHIEVRAFEMGSGHLGAAEGRTDIPEIAEEEQHVLVRTCQRRRQAGGGTVGGMASCSADDVFGRTVHEVEASASVRVEVYETGHDEGVAVIELRLPFVRDDRTCANLLYPPVLYPQGTGNNLIFKYKSAFQYHSFSIIHPIRDLFTEFIFVVFPLDCAKI